MLFSFISHYFHTVYTICTTKRLPQACAYLRKVKKEGECFSLRKKLSKRDTAETVVPMRLAICSCVSPASRRAASNACKAV